MSGTLEPTLAVVTAGAPADLTGVRPGAFASVEPIALAAGLAADPAVFAVAAAKAAEGFDWHVAVVPGEQLLPEALELLSPALGAYDAVFPALRITGAAEAVYRPSRAAFDVPEQLFHALLYWWVGARPFVRTAVQSEILAGLAPSSSAVWPVTYLDAIWHARRCLKTAQPLLESAAEPPGLDDAARAHVFERLETRPVFLPVRDGGRRWELPYTGRNRTVEREQTRGQFYEAMELDALAARIGPGAHVVDVGANTGNHTVYFAGPMAAARVVPLEPLPDAAEMLAAAVTRNGLGNVDLSLLGVGASGAPGRARAIRSERGGLGATRLEADPEGDIRIEPLDALPLGRVDFLKIDVESMELDVLAGASGLIAREKPVIFIEIANANVGAFDRWRKAAGYGVERIFPDKGHANYLISPGE